MKLTNNKKKEKKEKDNKKEQKGLMKKCREMTNSEKENN